MPRTSTSPDRGLEVAAVLPEAPRDRRRSSAERQSDRREVREHPRRSDRRDDTDYSRRERRERHPSDRERRSDRHGDREGDRHKDYDRHGERRRDDDRHRPDYERRDSGYHRDFGRNDRRDGRQEISDLPVLRGRGANRSGVAAQAAPRTAANEPADKLAKDAGGEAAAAPVAKRPGPAGGAYIPPFRLAQMMQESESKTDASYQRLTWDALRKSINGLVNKANAINIRPIIKELLSENLFRGRGLFCQSIMKSQVASPSYTPVFAALVSVIGTRLSDIPQLLVHRLVAQFKRAFKRNDRALTSSVVTFLCHLANQGVVDALLIAQMLMVLLSAKTDDSVELAVTALKESGALLQDTNPQMLRMIMDEMRTVLQEGNVEQRVQYIIEGLFKVQRDGFEASGFPQIPDGLDLVEDEDKAEVAFTIDTVPNIEQMLNVFKFDPEYEEREKEYEAEKKSWFDEDSGDESGDEGSDSEGSSGGEETVLPPPPPMGGMAIQDQTDTNLINLRRTIYLTIMSAMDFEEAGHKLMKIELGPGQEMEIVTMLIECCSQEKTYLRYYGLLAQRYCGHSQTWQGLYEECFRKQYAFVHRLETNKLRNVAKFFAHLLATDSVSWAVLDCIRITEDDTTSSSRIFIKILFQDLAENMGLQSLNERLQDPDCAPWFLGVFPKDTPRNMRFSINFFTSIGLGGLTDEMRNYLKELPKLLAAQQKAAGGDASSSDSSDSDSDDSSDSSSSSDSDDDSSSDSDDDSSDSSDSDSDSDSSDDTSSSGRPPISATNTDGRGTEIDEPPAKRGSKRSMPAAKSPKAGTSRPSKRIRAEKEPSRHRQEADRHRSSRRRA